jgi:thiol-disulfide isomerase/thioredoxin
MRKHFCILLVIFSTLQSQAQNLLNKNVPEFSGYMLDGTIVNQSILANKIVLLNFMFIGCQGCMLELPQLSKLDEKFRSDQFMIVSVIGNGIEDIKSYQGTGDTTKIFYTIRKTLKYDCINHLIIAECKNVDKKGPPNAIQTCTDNISKKFQIHEYPTNLLIDKNGKIVKTYNNLMIENDFMDLVAEIEKRLK